MLQRADSSASAPGFRQAGFDLATRIADPDEHGSALLMHRDALHRVNVKSEALSNLEKGTRGGTLMLNANSSPTTEDLAERAITAD